MPEFGKAKVGEVMRLRVVTVIETDKLEDVSQLFEENDFNAAPVVDRNGMCVGIITSHDIVEYEARRKTMTRMLTDSPSLGLGVCWEDGMYRIPGFLFDEVGFHMSKLLEPISEGDSLDNVARRMCQRHIHHVVILDNEEKPIGLLSSLDLLGFVIDEPVCRTPSCVTVKGESQ